MEPAEDASLEPAIRWLAQSILASPLISEQAPWVGEAGLAQEMEGLKSGIRGVQAVVSVIKGRALGNEPLAESLVHLKEVLHDAQDAVDELDYCRLVQLDLDLGGTTLVDPVIMDQTDGHHGAWQADRPIENADVHITSGTLTDPHETNGHGTRPVEGSNAYAAAGRRLRSKLWKEVQIIELDDKGAPVRAKCKHCQTELKCRTTQGTGVLQNHLRSKACPYPLSTAGAATNPAPRKRRTDEESTLLRTANINQKTRDILGVDLDNVVKERRYFTFMQLEQLDGNHGASQENADVPITSGTLPDPHRTEGHGMQLVDPHEMDGHGMQLDEISRGNAAEQNSSVGKLRSKLWHEFEIIEFDKKNGAPVRAKCKHCKTELGCPTKQGTGVLHNHLNSKACLHKKFDGNDPLRTADATTNRAPPLATGNLSSKKRRTDEESTCLRTANTNRLNMHDFSKMIQDITLKLHHIREGVIRVLSIPGSDLAASSNHNQGATSHLWRRTSSILQGRVYGRDSEKNNIIELMEEEKSATGATVLPILGIAGIGKTTLAQLVYNHPAVKKQFDHKVWIWVSNNFDAMELTKDMLGSVSQETHVGLCNFGKLQEILESRIKSKRVLLILDDVWDGINDYQWNQLLAPFNSEDARGNMIIVTTRKPCVAKRRGTVTPITLGALKSDDFWLFFEACAFGDLNHEKKESLSDLGQQIAQKLKGNPLAAETAGALLSEHRTVAHWSSVLKNEDWKSLTLSGGIMSALKLCYDQLPYHLQQCFSYCSLFPCNYEFLAEELVRIWISQGFVKHNNSSKRLEEIGQDYLADLVSLGFFEQFEKESSSGCTQICYVMYNLMHDFARVVSRTDCATIDGLQCKRMFPTVRHLSIISNSIYQMKDQTGNIARRGEFEEILRNTVTSVGKLRSLVLIGRYASSFFQFFQTAIQKAHNLRLLHLSVTSADSSSFLCNLVNPAHLQYLKLENGHTEHGALPQVLSKSFHLQVLDVNQYSGAWLPSGQVVHLDNSGEPRILPSLGRLQCLRRLKLSSIRNVREVSVPSLEELVLFEMPELKTCSCTSVGDLMSSLRVLEIQSCHALEVFDLFQKVNNYETEHNSWLPSMEKLIIRDCPDWHATIPLPPSAIALEIEGSSSQTLRIKPNGILGEFSCGMTLDDKFLSFHNMRDLKYLEIKNCCNLVSILSRTFGHLISLKSLKIKNCKELLSSDEELMPSNAGALPPLESLNITKCGITGKWLSEMLRHSPTLKKLYLDDCSQLTQLQIEEDKNIQSNLTSASEASSSGYYSLTSSAPDGLCHIPLNLTLSLKKITIRDCPYLIFDGSWKAFAGFTSLEKLTIQECPKLLSSSVHNDGQVDGRWLLPQSLEELLICEYSHETLRPCFVGNVTHLKKLEVSSSPRLKSLQLDSCSAIGYLRICRCNSLASLEGLRSLMNLRELNVVNLPVLASLATSGEGYEQIESMISSDIYDLPFLNGQLPGLESLHISKLSLLTSSFCEGLSSLRSLSLQYLDEPRLTDEQERALLLHRSLQELLFFSSLKLLDLPAGLHSLTSLKTLRINDCKSISRLPKEGLPPSLEELEIESCSYELSAQCRSLATGRRRVKIDGHYVN